MGSAPPCNANEWRVRLRYRTERRHFRLLEERSRGSLLTRHLLLAALFLLLASRCSLGQTNAYIRINQAGYLPADAKIAIAFSKSPLRGEFVLRDNANRVVFRGPLKSVAAPNWGGNFPHYYELDFSTYRQRGPICLATRSERHDFTRVLHRSVCAISGRLASLHAPTAVRLQPLPRHGLSHARWPYRLCSGS